MTRVQIFTSSTNITQHVLQYDLYSSQALLFDKFLPTILHSADCASTNLFTGMTQLLFFFPSLHHCIINRHHSSLLVVCNKKALSKRQTKRHYQKALQSREATAQHRSWTGS